VPEPAAAAPSDEGRHPPGPEQLWNESWYFDFAARDARLGGYVRLGLYPNLKVAWYWAMLVGEGRPLLAVRDHEVDLPRGPSLEVRAEGLWSTLTCETAHEHWTIGLEAFAAGLDDPAEAYHGERGDRVGLGFDLEWEAETPPYVYPGVSRYEQPCRVHGEILVGTERIDFDGIGQRDHSWGHRDWWSFPWCWTAGQLGDGTAFHASGVDVTPELRYATGYIAPGPAVRTAIDRFDVSTEVGDEGLPISAAMGLGELSMAVVPVAHAPVLLVAPDGRTSRFPRAMCRFAAADGRHGVGWTEWLQPPTGAVPPPGPA
jgi:hypothetical protein